MKKADRQRYYLCIDLKSFYASVECAERGLDPMTTDLVVADPERSRGTICLAVSPSLKEKGVKNRCRLFEIPDHLLKTTIIAPPRMQKYIDYAARIYGIYLEYISKDDIHVYSVDEAFLDVTDYLKLYHKTPKEMAEFLMQEVWERIGVRATAGVGTNLYLAKIALDITAKHSPDFIGVLDEQSYRETLWQHTPLTDFWRIGAGTARKLQAHRIMTMGDLAKVDEEMIYQLFGKDAELLIDHAWGRESTTIADIKKYRAKEKSYSLGQVLPRDYNYQKTLLAVKEMARDLCLRLVSEHKVMSSITLTLGYSYKQDDSANPRGDSKYHGSFASENHKPVVSGNHGSFVRSVKTLPHGTIKFDTPTSATREVVAKVSTLYQEIASREEAYRRIYLNCNHVVADNVLRQGSLFDQNQHRQQDKKVQAAMLDIQKKYGKTAIMRGEDLISGSTYRWRSGLIGGHKSGKVLENSGGAGKKSSKNASNKSDEILGDQNGQ